MSILPSASKILEIFNASEGVIKPHFILTGPSGSGKSYTVGTLCDSLAIPYFNINAGSLTKEGTSGNSLSKALTPLLGYTDTPVVCFVDEFDKLFISGNQNSNLAHETTNGVQNEFLTALEGTTSVFGDYGKYIPISTEKVLFVFAGAFNGEPNMDIDRLREMGIKTEFLGRVGITMELTKPTLAEMQAVLTSSQQLKHYLTLFTNVDKETVVEAVMAAVEENYVKNPIGLRMLNTLVHQYFIYGGIVAKQTKKVTFQRTLEIQHDQTSL